MNKVIQYSKQFKNGAPVVTKDGFAVKARIARMKRVMRSILRSYEQERIERNNKMDSASKVKHLIAGLVVGIAYCSLLLFVPL